MTDELLPVTQEDRDLAASIASHNSSWSNGLKSGFCDDDDMLQKIATHRLATPAPHPSNAELVERLRVKKQKLREQIKNCVVVINLMQPELDRFEKREGHNIYATRLAVDHQSNMRSLIKEADDLDSAIAALSTPDAGLLDEVKGYSYDDWETGDDDKVRIGDFCLFNFQDHNGIDQAQIYGKIVRHHENEIPVVVFNLDFENGALCEGDDGAPVGEYGCLQDLFMRGWSFIRITEKDALTKLEGKTP